MINKDEVDKIRSEIVQLKMEIEAAERHLQNLQSHCDHDWGVEYAPEEYREYWGTSSAHPFYENSNYYIKFRDRWKRTCKTCGLIQYTSQFDEKVERSPKFH